MCNANKSSCLSFIINIRIIIRISEERGWHTLQENENNLKIKTKFSKNYVLPTISTLFAVEYFAYQVKRIDVLYKKIQCHYGKKYFP